FASSTSWAGVLVMKDQTEVGPLSRRRMWPRRNPYPAHYRLAFAFSVLLYPQYYRQTLRPACPRGSATGLPSSSCLTGCGRRALSAGGLGGPWHRTHDPVSPPQSEVSASCLRSGSRCVPSVRVGSPSPPP